MGKMIARDMRMNWTGGCGGGCCNSKADQRLAKKGVKMIERRETRALADEEQRQDIYADMADEHHRLTFYYGSEDDNWIDWDELPADARLLYTTESARLDS